MKKMKRADVWVSDMFLEQGIEALVNESLVKDNKIFFVFFTADEYFNVVARNYNPSTHRLILLTQGLLYSFINDENIYRLDSRATMDTINSFMTIISDGDEKTRNTKEKIAFSVNEKAVLRCLMAQKNIMETASINKIHFKTVYHLRQSMSKKLGCGTIVELFSVIRSEIFKKWITGEIS